MHCLLLQWLRPVGRLIACSAVLLRQHVPFAIWMVRLVCWIGLFYLCKGACFLVLFSVCFFGEAVPLHTPFVLYLCSVSSTCFGSLGIMFPPGSCTLLLACVVLAVLSLALAGSLFPHACSVQMYFGLLVFQLV